MPDRDTIRFILDGELVELRDVDPTRTVLDFLREDRRLKGSKEGCREGDCGACTVAIAELAANGDTVQLKAINSCIQFLPTLDGKELITVAGIETGSQLHPVQQSMVQNHGSQCGFCTPGFVMSLFVLYETHSNPGRQEIDDALAGNLCRCTGYRPIVAAAREMYTLEAGPVTDRSVALQKLQRSNSLAIDYRGRRFFAPGDTEELADLLQSNPDAIILAGGTDIGLWVTKQYRELNTIIYTGRVAELQRVEVNDTHIVIGGAATLSACVPSIVAHYSGLDEMFRRFASPPVRNAGTLGGNIANGSPIGDSMAALMTIGTTLLLQSGSEQREIELSDFYHDYMANDLQPGEFIAQIKIPLPSENEIVQCHKWSKRFDQDISAVCTAYRLQLDGDRVESFRMACGGLAATVRRAQATEQAIANNGWNSAAIEAACAALADEFAPISDMRASAHGRMRAAQNLLRRFYAETQAEDAKLETVFTYGR